MAKVDSLSHTHLVLNESTSTALQPLADQDPSREELHGRKTHTDTHAHAHRQKGDAVNIETAPAKGKKRAVQIPPRYKVYLIHFTCPPDAAAEGAESEVNAALRRLLQVSGLITAAHREHSHQPHTAVYCDGDDNNSNNYKIFIGFHSNCNQVSNSAHHK